MNRVNFSVIVSFYNEERFIAGCLASLLEQDYPKDKYEIIFVDNNSADGSRSAVEKYPFVKLIRENRQGAYTARNTGSLAAKGDFLVFSDADVLAPVNWLSAVSRAVNNGNPDIIIGWYSPAGAGRLLRIHSLLVSERIEAAVRSGRIPMVTASASNLVIRKSVFEKEGRFLDIPRSEDKYFVLRSLEKGYKVCFDRDIEVVRSGIDSLKTALLKNFRYGYANALYVNRRFSPFRGIDWKLLFKWFPAGAGLLLFSLLYFAGYSCGRIRGGFKIQPAFGNDR